MRLLFAIFFIVCAMLSVRSVYAGTVSTIDDIALMNNVENCIACHDDIAAHWKRSSHAKSAVDWDVLDFIKQYSKSKSIYLIKSCSSCHAPQLKDASDKLIGHIADLIVVATDSRKIPEREAAIKELAKLSINCRVCHMIKGTPRNQAGPGIIYGPGWNEHEHSHKDWYGFDTIKTEYFMSSKFCTSCHGNFPSNMLFSEYSSLHKKNAGHYTEDHGNKTCQNCHMKSDHTFRPETKDVTASK